MNTQQSATRWTWLKSRFDLQPSHPVWPGAPLALASAALFGASTPLAKVLLGSIDPWLLAGILYLGAGAGLWIARQAEKALSRVPPEAQLSRRDLPWLAGAILAGGILGPILLMLGLARVGAGGASLLLNVEGLATMAIAWVVFRENVDTRLLIGAGAILGGAVILSWNGASFTIDFGALLVVAACAAWGIDNNLTRKLFAADPQQIAMIKGLVAGSVGSRAFIAAWREPTGLGHRSTGRASRVPWLRREPCALRRGAPPPGYRKDGRILFAGAFSRRFFIAPSSFPARGCDPAARRGGPAHGHRSLSPSSRAA